MQIEYPYQLVSFPGVEPAIGEPVYYGTNGWYPQIALKRRFAVRGIDEEELCSRLAAFCKTRASFIIKTTEVVKPVSMPVKVIPVTKTRALMELHRDFIAYMGESIVSRYPDRDGENYLPHITAEYDNKMVIDTTKYTNREFTITKIFLLKDVEDENSVAYRSFPLA